jgi:hypothetical protein
MKETAVEFLFKELCDTPKDKFAWYYLFEKAKQIEKQQIMDSYNHGISIGYDHGFYQDHPNDELSQAYYNETYGKDA